MRIAATLSSSIGLHGLLHRFTGFDVSFGETIHRAKLVEGHELAQPMPGKVVASRFSVFPLGRVGSPCSHQPLLPGAKETKPASIGPTAHPNPGHARLSKRSHGRLTLVDWNAIRLVKTGLPFERQPPRFLIHGDRVSREHRIQQTVRCLLGKGRCAAFEGRICKAFFAQEGFYPIRRGPGNQSRPEFCPWDHRQGRQRGF